VCDLIATHLIRIHWNLWKDEDVKPEDPEFILYNIQQTGAAGDSEKDKVCVSEV